MYGRSDKRGLGNPLPLRQVQRWMNACKWTDRCETKRLPASPEIFPFTMLSDAKSENEEQILECFSFFRFDVLKIHRGAPLTSLTLEPSQILPDPSQVPVDSDSKIPSDPGQTPNLLRVSEPDRSESICSSFRA